MITIDTSHAEGAEGGELGKNAGEEMICVFLRGFVDGEVDVPANGEVRGRGDRFRVAGRGEAVSVGDGLNGLFGVYEGVDGIEGAEGAGRDFEHALADLAVEVRGVDASAQERAHAFFQDSQYTVVSHGRGAIELVQSVYGPCGGAIRIVEEDKLHFEADEELHLVFPLCTLQCLLQQRAGISFPDREVPAQLFHEAHHAGVRLPIVEIGTDPQALPVRVQLIVTRWSEPRQIEAVIREKAECKTADFERLVPEAEGVLFGNDNQSEDVAHVEVLVAEELDRGIGL